MRKGNFYLGAFVALAMGALVGCSKDDGESAKVTPDMTTSFANICIVMPDHTGTRAEDDEPSRATGGYENGTAEENKIDELLLVFYDAQGNVVGSSTRKDITGNNRPTGDPIETIYSNTVEIKLNEGANMPASVMAYVNPANTTSQNDRLDRVRSLTRDINQLQTDGAHFLMNNSGHYEGGVYTIASKVNPQFIYADKEEAEKSADKAAVIYVERVAAKVKVAMNPNPTINEPEVTSPDGAETYSLKFVPESWALTATARTTMLLKNLNVNTADLNAAFNGDAAWITPSTAPYRTFWARSYGYGIPSEVPQPAEGIKFPVTGEEEGNYLLDYITLADENFQSLKNGDAYISMNDTKAVYIPENTMRGERFTSPENFPNPYASVTSAIVKGHYEVTGDDADKFADGFYLRKYSKVTGEETTQVYAIYTEDELKKAMLENQPYFRVNENDATGTDAAVAVIHKDEASDITGAAVKNPANRYTIQIAANYNGPIFTPTTNDDGTTTWNQVTADRETVIARINADLEKFAGQAMYYNGGKAFFYVPIKHNGTGSNAFIEKPKTGDYGIVRNHSYQVTINSISGLATGVADENDKPLPDPTPTQTYFINATMNVLAWHVMSQSVDL